MCVNILTGCEVGMAGNLICEQTKDVIVLPLLSLSLCHIFPSHFHIFSSPEIQVDLISCEYPNGSTVFGNHVKQRFTSRVNCSANWQMFDLLSFANTSIWAFLHLVLSLGFFFLQVFKPQIPDCEISPCVRTCLWLNSQGSWFWSSSSSWKLKSCSKLKLRMALIVVI